jgi:SAM-dependent methyltransferase
VATIKQTYGNRYLAQERGNRAAPDQFHPRYWGLTFLLRRLQAIVDSDVLRPGEMVLDYGCGNKPYEALFRTKFRRYLGADFAGNDDAQVVVGPHGELPLEPESVDCVLSTQVLEHVEDPRSYLAEAYRVLRTQGSLVLSTHGMWRYHPDPTDYWRWTLDGLRREITRAGFDIWSTQSVLGMASCAVQLWQDASVDRLPRPVQRGYVWLLQSVIGLIECRQTNRLSTDASLYVIFARKRASRSLNAAQETEHQLALATQEATERIPTGKKVILIDQDELGPALLPGCQIVPFAERNGHYAGPPSDNRHALREFERIRGLGAQYVIFAWPAFWWLDYYHVLTRRLRSKFHCVLDNDRLVIFDLRRAPEGEKH